MPGTVTLSNIFIHAILVIQEERKGRIQYRRNIIEVT